MSAIENIHARRIVELTQSMGERPPIDFDAIKGVEEDPDKIDWNIDESLEGVQMACATILFPLMMIAAIFGFSLYATNRD